MHKDENLVSYLQGRKGKESGVNVIKLFMARSLPYLKDFFTRVGYGLTKKH